VRARYCAALSITRWLMRRLN